MSDDTKRQRKIPNLERIGIVRHRPIPPDISSVESPLPHQHFERVARAFSAIFVGRLPGGVRPLKRLVYVARATFLFNCALQLSSIPRRPKIWFAPNMAAGRAAIASRIATDQNLYGILLTSRALRLLRIAHDAYAIAK